MNDAALSAFFGKKGDSGSVVVDEDINIVGLYFAGNASGTVGVANPIAGVLTALDISICTKGIKKLEKEFTKEFTKEWIPEKLMEVRGQRAEGVSQGLEGICLREVCRLGRTITLGNATWVVNPPVRPGFRPPSSEGSRDLGAWPGRIRRSDRGSAGANRGGADRSGGRYGPDLGSESRSRMRRLPPASRRSRPESSRGSAVFPDHSRSHWRAVAEYSDSSLGERSPVSTPAGQRKSRSTANARSCRQRSSILRTRRRWRRTTPMARSRVPRR